MPPTDLKSPEFQEESKRWRKWNFDKSMREMKEKKEQTINRSLNFDGVEPEKVERKEGYPERPGPPKGIFRGYRMEDFNDILFNQFNDKENMNQEELDLYDEGLKLYHEAERIDTEVGKEAVDEFQQTPKFQEYYQRYMMLADKRKDRENTKKLELINHQLNHSGLE